MAQNFKKLCLKPVQHTLLDEIRVIKNIVDFRISAVESKIDLLISTCTSIFSNSEITKSHHNDSIKSLNDLTESFEDKFRNLEELISVLISSGLCKNCNLNRVCNETLSQKDEVSNLDICKGQNFRLNTADDYPNGSWLGDENDWQSRVRVNIDPNNLLHINEKCTTPEKMALTLIDALFTRDVLAVSNLSGKGKHSKQQLDPLLIYGIKCHLKYKFNITEAHWFRIQRNIDSKCRTIWRRKKRGLPLGNHQGSTIINTSQPDVNGFDSSDECLEQVVCYEIPESQKVADIPSNAVVEDIQLSVGKSCPEDDFHLLPSVQLFTVETADCFMLEGNELVIPERIIKDVDQAHDFLNK